MRGALEGTHLAGQCRARILFHHAAARQCSPDQLVDVAGDLESGICVADALLEFCRSGHGLARDHEVPHAMKFVNALLQHLPYATTRGHASIVDRYQQRFQFVTQVAHGRDTGHSCTAL